MFDNVTVAVPCTVILCYRITTGDSLAETVRMIPHFPPNTRIGAVALNEVDSEIVFAELTLAFGRYIIYIVLVICNAPPNT